MFCPIFKTWVPVCVDYLGIIPSNCNGWLGKDVPTMQSFLMTRKYCFLVLLLTCTKLTFNLFCIHMFTIFANRVGPLLPLYRIVRLKWSGICYYLIRKSFQYEEEWRLFYCDSALGCRVIQDFDLCKLDELWCHFAPVAEVVFGQL